MRFSGQECWSELPFPSPGNLPNPGIEPKSPTLQVDSLPLITCIPNTKEEDHEFFPLNHTWVGYIKRHQTVALAPEGF